MTEASLLFQPHNFIFWVPMGIALLLWLISLLGIVHHTDIDSLHSDWDIDWHFDWVDIGKIPLSLILTLLLFTFGSIGLGFQGLLSYFWLPHNLWWLSIVAGLLAFFPAFFMSAFISRKLQPLFKDYGKATQTSELIGMTAIVNSSTITENFGSIRVTQKNGYEIELAARAISSHQPIASGKKVIIVSFEKDKNLYFVVEVES